MMSRNFDRSWREIDSRHLRATARKLQEIGSHAAANFQQTLARELIEAHHLWHPRRVFLISVSLDFIKEFARPNFMLRTIDRTSGIFTPLFTSALFFVSHGVRTACGSGRLALRIDFMNG